MTKGIAALAAALLFGACGLSTNDEPTPIAQENVPPDLQEGDTPSSSAVYPDSGNQQVIQIWLLEAGEDAAELQSVERTVPHPASASRVLEVLFNQGPTEDEREQGLSTAIPSDAQLAGAPVQNEDVVQVSLTDATYEGLSGANSSNAFAQIVYTVTEIVGIEAVEFLLEDGEAIQVPDGEGQTRTGPLTREDYENLVAT